MKKKLKILTLLLTVVLFISISVIHFSADFGGYSGDSDFGGDWGGGSDWDSDWGDDDWSDSGTPLFFFGDVGGGGSLSGVVIIIIIIVVIVILKNKGKLNNKVPIAPGAVGVDRSTLRPVSEYMKIDPQFSDNNFKEKLSNLYVQFQNDWTDKNIEPLRPYLTDTAFAQFDRQLESLRQKKQTNHIDRITVLDADILGFTQDGTNDKMYARMKTRITDYVTDDATGNIVQGSDRVEKFMEYEWELIRKTGVTTFSAAEKHETNCPNCGAPININHSAKCEYCGSILSTDSYDWVISSIKAISQRTSG